MGILKMLAPLFEPVMTFSSKEKIAGNLPESDTDRVEKVRETMREKTQAIFMLNETLLHEEGKDFAFAHWSEHAERIILGACKAISDEPDIQRAVRDVMEKSKLEMTEEAQHYHDNVTGDGMAIIRSFLYSTMEIYIMAQSFKTEDTDVVPKLKKMLEIPSPSKRMSRLFRELAILEANAKKRALLS